MLSLNLYAYCENNPVRYSDPDGNTILSDLLEKIIKKFIFIENDVLSISVGIIAGVIDLVIMHIPGLNGLSTLLIGVKNTGKILGEKVAKRIFKSRIESILYLLTQVIIDPLIETLSKILGFAINLATGFIGNNLFDLFWSFTSIGNFFGLVFDMLDTKRDGYFRVGVGKYT